MHGVMKISNTGQGLMWLEGRDPGPLLLFPEITFWAGWEPMIRIVVIPA